MVLAIEDGRFEHIDKLFKPFLPVELGLLSEVFAVVEEQIEGIEYNSVLTPAGEVSLEFGEVGPTLMDDDRFTIKDRLALLCEGAGDVGESFRPGMAVAGEKFGIAPIDMGLEPIAVVFDFVNPLLTRRSLALKGGKLGLDEARHINALRHSRNSRTK